MTKVNPGALRIVSPTYDGGFLSPHDLVIEVQKEDGSWLRLRTAVELTIKMKPDSPVIATIGLLTSEVDLWGIDPAEVEFVRARFPFAPERHVAGELRKAALTIRARTVTPDGEDPSAYLAAVARVEDIADQLDWSEEKPA